MADSLVEAQGSVKQVGLAGPAIQTVARWPVN